MQDNFWEIKKWQRRATHFEDLYDVLTKMVIKDIADLICQKKMVESPKNRSIVVTLYGLFPEREKWSFTNKDIFCEADNECITQTCKKSLHF